MKARFIFTMSAQNPEGIAGINEIIDAIRNGEIQREAADKIKCVASYEIIEK